MTAPESCPKCATDLRGPAIPEEYLRDGSYGPWNGEPRYYSRVIGREVPGVYDGTLFWQCPDCGHRWHRFPEGSPYRLRAMGFVDALG